MPMFFFLSGISAYFALFKRTEQQFRDERVHRLLVPWLFSFLIKAAFSITYFGPNCEEFYFQNGTHEMEARSENASRRTGCITGEDQFHESFGRFVAQHYQGIIPGQAWFLLPLFVYSQILTHLFILWHPAHSSTTVSGLPCCGRKICCTRPFSCCVKMFSCIYCFGKPATSPEALVNSTVWWLGSVWKLGLLPGLIFTILPPAFGTIIRLTLPDIEYLIYFAVPPIPNFNYIMILIFGYTITAADAHGIKDVLQKGRWIYLCSGILLQLTCSIPTLPYLGIIRLALVGFSEWLLILGWYGIARELIVKRHPWLNYLGAIAMPFYLTHQHLLLVIVSGTLWIPHLSSFPVNLILTTFATVLMAHLIIKMTNFRYFFGIPTATNSFLPGKKIRGFIPVILLSIIVIISMVLGGVFGY